MIMTLGRMANEERAKGFDQVIDLMPSLIRDIPNLVYLVVGDGTDRARLEAKVRDSQLQNHVVFTGRVDDAMKADVYGLADAYVMPSMGEGFGFVVLEAMASGVPVVVSSKDGTREAVRDGELGLIVDPADSNAIRQGVIAALKKPRGIPEGIDYFSFENFSSRLRRALD